MKTLLIRSVSALVAMALLWAVWRFFANPGVLVLISIASCIGIREGARILFAEETAGTSWLFTLLSIFLFVFGLVAFDFTAAALTLMFVCLFPLGLMILSPVEDLERLLKLQARGLLGLAYLSLLPLFACHLLDLAHGLTWFLALLAFVFTGDTFAYLVGWRFGRKLLLPSISPKKTQEGSVGGLVGSVLAGYVFHFFLPFVPLYWLMLLALVVGALGQMGDLFESLLKRVAHTKDSGSLMPGHGGVLDRIDGVLFAAPMMFIGASLLEKWF